MSSEKQRFCRKLYLKEFIRCKFGFSDTEFYVLYLLLKSDFLSVNQIAEKLQKERTTIQKIINKFKRRGLVVKYQENLERGYRYIYKVKDKNKIIEEIERELENYIRELLQEAHELKSFKQ